MKIFIDSANTEEIKKYLDQGLCDGVTTNPTTFFKAGILGRDRIKEKILEISQLIGPRPLSFEVASENPEEIINQAREFSAFAGNIVVKVTVTDSRGGSLLGAINQLVKEGVMVNVTMVTTFNQAMLSAKAIADGLKSQKARKPHFISIFAGRIAEEYGVQNSFNIIKDSSDWVKSNYPEGIEIIIASIRNPENVEYFSKTGAHVMTIPPEVLAKSLLSAKTNEGVARFLEDAKKSQ